MSVPAHRVQEILGLKIADRGIAGLAAAVQRGLPRSALTRVVDRTGVTGKARLALLWDDPAAAKRFIATPHPELGNRTPIDCAGSELGARQVEDIVMRAIHGLPV